MSNKVKTCEPPCECVGSGIECPWWINSPKHHNCLWEYIADKSGPDGSMNELVQSEISALLDCSNTKTHFMLKDAMVLLIQALTDANANQFLEQEPDLIVDIGKIQFPTGSNDDHD